MSECITFRLGPLREPLDARCEKTGETPSEVIRLGLAKELDVPVPELVPGNPNAAAQSKKANAARWKKRKKKS